MTSPTDAGYDPAEHYDRVTGAWRLLLGDELHYGVFGTGDESLPQATTALTDLMVAGAQLDKGLRVLDVGCGSGAPACTLAERFGVSVVGITTSAVGVQTAQHRADDLGLAEVTFELRDGTDNGLPDESFDRVWVLESSHLMRERTKLIAECARVLRPGGRMVLCDLVRHREIPFREVRDRRADFVTLRTAFGDAHFEPLTFYTAIAEANGLVVDTVMDLTHATLPTFDRWRDNAETHRTEVAAAIGEDGRVAFVASCDILEGFWSDGTFGYGLFAAAKPIS
jgi:27-O-demethylrifamycin SV methyltransferase